jgi:hypothetical protein
VTDVAKSKRAPALFEVIESKQLQGTSSKLVLPKWWRSGRGANPNYPPVEQPEEKLAEEKPVEQGKIIKLTPTFARPMAQQSLPVTPPPKPAPVVAPPVPTSSHAAPLTSDGRGQGSAPAESGSRPPTVQTRGGRIQLSLNPINAAIIVGVVIAAVLASYKLGSQFTSGKSMQDDLGKAMQDKKQPGVLTPSLAELGPAHRSGSSPRETRSESPPPSRDRHASRTGASTPPSPSPAAGTSAGSPPAQAGPAEGSPAGREAIAARKVGMNYLYLPLMKSEHRDQAVRGQQWLMSKGLAFTIEDEGGRPQLVSVEGFDYTNAAEKAKAEELRAKVKNLAAAFRKELKSDYDISSMQMKKLKD